MTARVGLTGGIGSGKSSVATLFSKHGIVIIDADLIAREITAPGTEALDKIRIHFGKECIHPNGTLNRQQLGEIVFHNTEGRAWLEQLLHPLIKKESDARATLVEAPYCILEIPLLLETKRHKEMDAVIVVDCDQEIRMERLIKSRSMDRESIKRVFASQASDEERLKIANYIINNNGAPEALVKQVDTVHQQLTDVFD